MLLYFIPTRYNRNEVELSEANRAAAGVKRLFGA